MISVFWSWKDFQQSIHLSQTLKDVHKCDKQRRGSTLVLPVMRLHADSGKWETNAEKQGSDERSEEEDHDGNPGRAVRTFLDKDKGNGDKATDGKGVGEVTVKDSMDGWGVGEPNQGCL